MKVVDWIRHRCETRTPPGGAKAECDKFEVARLPIFNKYVSEYQDAFQKHLYRYFLDFSKEKARTDIPANKDLGVFEAYRMLLPSRRKLLQT